MCRAALATEFEDEEEEVPSEDIEETLRHRYPGLIFGATLRMIRQELSY